MFPHDEIQIGYLYRNITKEWLYSSYCMLSGGRRFLFAFVLSLSRKDFFKKQTVLAIHGTKSVMSPRTGEWVEEYTLKQKL